MGDNTRTATLIISTTSVIISVAAIIVAFAK